MVYGLDLIKVTRFYKHITETSSSVKVSNFLTNRGAITFFKKDLRHFTAVEKKLLNFMWLFTIIIRYSFESETWYIGCATSISCFLVSEAIVPLSVSD
jgi:hypothetical protein